MRINFDMEKEDVKKFDDMCKKLEVSRAKALRIIIKNIEKEELKNYFRKVFK